MQHSFIVIPSYVFLNLINGNIIYMLVITFKLLIDPLYLCCF